MELPEFEERDEFAPVSFDHLISAQHQFDRDVMPDGFGSR
jgi:hypothetical protein